MYSFGCGVLNKPATSANYVAKLHAKGFFLMDTSSGREHGHELSRRWIYPSVALATANVICAPAYTNAFDSEN